MKKEAKDKDFIKKPIYDGGPQAMKKFIRKNLRYPKEALEKKVEGTVYVKFDIDYKGKVTEAKVVSGIGYGCDEEAVRLVKMFEFKVPKGPRKLRVVFHKNIQIHFRLPKQSEQTKMTINYSAQKADTETTDKKEKPTKSYSYTIKW